MQPDEASVGVWVGVDLMQAQLLRQALVDEGIECVADRDPGILPAGELGAMGLWVAQHHEARARVLLEWLQGEMSAAGEAGFPEDETAG